MRKYIFHVEDDSSWQSLVKNSIKDIPQYEISYVPFTDNFEESLQKIFRFNTPGILILDLNLNTPITEYKTVVDLNIVQTNLLSRSIGLIILSGYLNSSIKPLLIKSGVPRNQIFDKGNFFAEEEKFINEIARIFQEIDDGIFNSYPVVKNNAINKDIIDKLTLLQSTVETGFNDLKLEKTFLFNQLSTINQQYVLKIIDYLKKGQIRQQQIERMVTICINELKDFKLLDSENNEKENEYLKNITIALNANLSLEHQLELTVPIIPFLLEYKMHISAETALDTIWNELKNLLKSDIK